VDEQLVRDPLLQEDLLAAVNWGPVSPEWLEIEAAEFPENPGSCEDLETGMSIKKTNRDSESTDNTKVRA